MYDVHTPIRLDETAPIQPTIRRRDSLSASIVPQTAGTISYANVKRTPAMRTKLTTTIANDA
jgi:hypothetical protein